MSYAFQCRPTLVALAILFGFSVHDEACAQQEPLAGATVQTPLDPESPLAPMEDIGVAWPEIPTPSAEDKSAAENTQSDITTDIVAERRYEVGIVGLSAADEAKIAKRFALLSTLKAGEGKSANVAQIDRRAREDAELLESILRAEGYYDAVITTRVDPAKIGSKLIVTLNVEAGPLYRFADVRVDGLEKAGQKGAELREAFPVEARDPVNADDVLAAQSTLKNVIGKEGFPFAKISEPDIVVDHDTRTATLSMTVDPGGEQRIGKITVKGDKAPFGAEHVERIARFKSGQVFRQDRIDDLRRAITATGLVSAVTVDPTPGATPDTVDLSVGMEPAPMRTIAGEFGYGTGEGLRAEVSWTHRNLVRPEGAVTLRGVVGTKEQLAGVTLRQSNFGKRDQVLNGRILLSNINQNAFKARTFEVAAGIERQTNLIWQKKWIWSLGFELLASDERDVVVGPSSRKRFFIGALPATLNYDGSDNLLDPTRGFRVGLRFSPELSFSKGTFGYARAQLDASAYLPTGKSVVLAGRARLGVIAGAGLNQIAPSRRLYSGGGGSVRGYSYQAIGPLDVNNDPVGGQSLAEFALEARIRLKIFEGAFSVVPFVDGGNVYRGSTPDFSGFRYGAGLGLRYHSSFGPIRIDVATPVNPRKGDSPVALYVSLGQAF